MPVPFDETPIGLRRRRSMVDGRWSMVEGMLRLEAQATAIAGSGMPTLDGIAAVTLYDHQQLRFGDKAWLPDKPRFKALADAWNARASFART